MIKKVIKKVRKALFANEELEIRKNDVYLVSFPKSGNTWMRFLLINYLFNKEQKKLTYNDLENYLPSIHKSSISHINSIGENRIVRSHFISLKYP